MFNRKLKKRIEELEENQAKLEQRTRATMEQVGFTQVNRQFGFKWMKPRFSVFEKTDKLFESLKLEMIKVPGKVQPEKIIIKKIRTTPKKKEKK